MNCYNCGTALTGQTNHREHIPAKNLFDGFPDSHKQNRVVVSACYTCNQFFSPIDEEFRNLIGIVTRNPNAIKLTEKTTRSMSRLQSKIARVIYSVSNRMPFAVQFNMNDIAKYHLKNFKGLFYHKYGRRISEDQYRIMAHFDKTFESERSQRLINYLTQNFNFQCSGHEDVFRYILQPFRQGHQGNGEDITPIEDERFYMAIMSYTKSHAALIMAERLI
jgi:hypothetical protein